MEMVTWWSGGGMVAGVQVVWGASDVRVIRIVLAMSM